MIEAPKNAEKLALQSGIGPVAGFLDFVCKNNKKKNIYIKNRHETRSISISIYENW